MFKYPKQIQLQKWQKDMGEGTQSNKDQGGWPVEENQIKSNLGDLITSCEA